MKDCVFCKILRDEIPCDCVYEDDRVVAFLDIAPLSKGHTLIIPRDHHNSSTTVPAEVLGRMMAVVPQIGAAMMRATGADGFNLLLSNGACAGQVVPHAHLHVVPRSPTDGIRLPTDTVEYDSDEEKQDILTEARKRLKKRVNE